ncbi:MAG: LamB/YcsF family protein, partial [Chloroflexota bacterium]|nr:LamB/YcsF family protein [Chloroflexota bacterium]
MRTSIDLNSDLGEGAGTDAQLMPLISSANIACGGHAGDEATMRESIALARRYGVAVGAHPGYPDRENFGRIPVAMTHDALSEEIARQIRALRSVDPDLKISHVKAHGALYNEAWRDKAIAKAIVETVKRLFTTHTDVALFAPPKSALAEAAVHAGLRVVREGFADRAYEKDGTLRSRQL